MKRTQIRRITVLATITLLGVLYFFYYKSNQNKKDISKVIKEVSKVDKIEYSVNTILFTKNKSTENHITSLKNILFYNDKIIVTKGGVIKGDFINRYFNATEFKDISYNDKTLIIGYKNGFLLFKNDYINNFNFNEIIKKCVFEKDDFYCIKENQIIKKEKDNFIKFYDSKYKIRDILFQNHKIYILTDKNLIIKDNYVEKRIALLNANKIIDIDNKIFLVSDREVFEVKGNRIVSFKKLPSVYNLILKNDQIYYLTINGVIYNNDLKKEYSINSLVNSISYSNKNVYISTENGVYLWDNKINKLKISIINNTIKENYITNISKFDSENILISYFNSGVDVYNPKSFKVSNFISNLNGVNDILLKDDKIYVATTNGLYVYDRNLLKSDFEYYDKKNGIIGTSISQVSWYKDKIFLGSEGGISQKTGKLFNSIYGLHGLVNNRVNSLKNVGDLLYVGTLGGVSILNGLKVIKTLNNKNFRSRWITALESINDKVYIGTYGGGVYLLENNEIEELTDSKERIFINLNTFFNYSNKYLLAGTLKNGVWVYNVKKNKHFFIKDLPSLNITAIKIIDDKIFIGSDFGFWYISVNDVLR